MKAYKRLLLSFVLLLLILPFIQFNFPLIPVRALDGDVHLAVDTSLTSAGWFSSRYQEVKDKFLSDNFGFRAFYVRLRNELYYDLFNKIYAKDVIAGKHGFLYELKYVQTHAGYDYLGKEKITQLFEKIKFIQDTLEKKGIHFAVLLAPGKATFYPEHIPSPYDISPDTTNYIQFKNEVVRSHINAIDYNQWFADMKLRTKHPLYPKTGTHWSIYGMHVALDTLVRYIERKSHKKLSHFDYSQVKLSDSLIYPDGDIAGGLNILRELPHFTMAYPQIKWKDTAGTFHPRVLTVSDSYWMGIYFTELPQHIFSQHEFWYYNKMLYHYDPEGKTANTLDKDLQSSVEQNQFVFVMATEASLKHIGWGIIEDLYNLYHNGPNAYRLAEKLKYKTAEMNQIRYQVWNDEKWLGQCKDQARRLGLSVDSCVNMNVRFYYDEVHKNDKPLSPEDFREIEILKIKVQMDQSKEWHAHMVQKAADMHISLDECMTGDAIWMLEQRQLSERITHFKNEIKATPTWLKEVIAKAAKWGIPVDSAITLDAKYMAEQELKKK